ncbi:hypothetical protein MANAM107_24050 [Actinomyces capricornis]|uniref:TetR family transcriptional regulator n=1 Tax=Actinomyces capricornis TaxID=2755559 RepID=A0ABM7UPZ7_9ACTO|nr:hypothetical protein MANAM107_24050 [Actinomyces capricornis]
MKLALAALFSAVEYSGESSGDSESLRAMEVMMDLLSVALPARCGMQRSVGVIDRRSIEAG